MRKDCRSNDSLISFYLCRGRGSWGGRARGGRRIWNLTAVERHRVAMATVATSGSGRDSL